MKIIFHARSPLWQVLVYSLFFLGVLLYLLVEPGGDDLPRWLPLTLSGTICLIALVYVVVILRYNRANPENRIRYWGLVPPELKEEDEGMLAFTSRATRRVYVFHATLLPLMSVAMFLSNFNPFVVLFAMAILTFGHLLVYWVSIWPVWREEIAGEE